MASLAQVRAQREVDRIVREEWGPGDPPAAPASAIRHGRCRLTLEIGGVPYSLSPRPVPEGNHLTGLVVLTKRDGSRRRYAVAASPQDAHCTCPDHTERKSICKHISALQAVSLVLRGLCPPPSPTAPAVAVPAPKPRRQKGGFA
jgi:hypothetical protein